ncbi:MAG: DNA-binding response regulator [Cytophagales bacterium CG18_big_fil_WC_8_21_14_2_50_42_9]|nr:MAG: DNA-binding response regulator [Cytophagales bacterium CG18_big_fil_WC_8_21_14_2_50_42_9]
MVKILLVEDDPNLGFLVQDSLERNGYLTDVYTDGAAGLKAFQQQNFDLCILDVMLPIFDGFFVAQEIRKENTAVPIIFLTAKARPEDRILGLTIGADDYLTKPFQLEELKLRIKAILKRIPSINLSAITKPDTFSFGQSSLDYSNLLLTVKGNNLTLTQKEASVLRLLCQSQHKLIKRNYILKTVWEDEGYFVGRSLDVFISKLRKYLKADSSIRIVNIHGVGYKMEVGEV